MVQNGDSVLLKCRVVGENPISPLEWTRHNRELLSDRVEDKSDGIILISNTTAAEAGEYVCRGGSLEKRTTITIQRPQPVAILPNSPEISLDEGDKLNLFCFSEFLSTLTWYKLGGTDQYEGIKQVDSSYKISHVKHNISRNDEGTYICRGIKRNLKTEQQIKVVVQSKQNAGKLWIFTKEKVLN